MPTLRAIHATDEVGRWWGPVPAEFPFGDDPEETRFAIVYDGAVAGMIQYGEEQDPEWRYAWIDIFVAPDLHGRGIGTEAVAQLAAHLMDERGHHRVTIDPSTDNAAAIRCYEKAGFRRVGVMEAAWRDRWTGEWRDTLYMELVRRPARNESPPRADERP